MENLSSSSNSTINANTSNNYTVYATNEDYSTKTGNVYQDHDTTYFTNDKENTSNVYDEFASSHYYTSRLHDTSYDDDYRETSTGPIYDTLNKSCCDSISYSEENTRHEEYTTNSYYQDHFALSNMLINDTGDVKELYNGYVKMANNTVEQNLSSANRTIQNSVINNGEITEISDISFDDGEEIDAEVQEIIKQNLIENNENSEFSSTIDISSILTDTALLHHMKNLDENDNRNNKQSSNYADKNKNYQFEPINKVVRNQPNQEDLGIHFVPYNETISNKVVDIIDKNNFKSNPGVYKLSDLIFS